MAFGLSNSNAPFGAQGGLGTSGLQAPQAKEGPELQEIFQDVVKFARIGGESSLQVLTNPWPSDSLPIPTSSLLAVASSKDLVIAAGPNSLVLAKASKIRKLSKSKSTEQGTFEPDLTIPIPRVSQVVLSADEKVLVISAESGGSLAAYQVDGLLNNQTDPALQLPTNNKGLRALAANPTPEKAELFAAVTVDGELLIANLKTSSLTKGANGPVLKDQVSCVAWSNKGKQLVAGLADGTACQITPEGEGKAVLPKPPSLPEGMHVSAISWLENDVFLVFYSQNSEVDMETYLVTRKKNTAEFTFQSLPEVSPPLGLERPPNVPLLVRLRNYPPHLSDMILVGSTCASEIGLVTKSEKALSSEVPVTGTYTTTKIDEDQNKAMLPLSQGADTTAIGLSIDLSSHDTVLNPLPTSPDIAESKYPVPNLLVLNHEGVLCTWNIIYADSVVEEKAYPQLVVTGGLDQHLNQPPTAEAATKPISDPPQSGFGRPAFGSSAPPSKFGQPAAASTFGTPAGQSGFGNRPTSSFGAPGTLGGAKPSWISTGIDTSSKPQGGSSGFGQPSFGSPAALGPSTPQTGFGASAPRGGTAPAFGQSAFGQTSLAGGTSSPLGVPGNKQPSGFASFAGTGVMSGFGAMKQTTDSPFGAKSGESAFTKSSTPLPLGGDTAMTSSFGTPETKVSEGKGAGLPQGGFQIGSTFKADPQSDQERLGSSEKASSLGFGKGFSDLLNQDSKDENMDEDGTPARKSSPGALATGSLFGAKGNDTTPGSFGTFGNQTKPAPTTTSIFGTLSKTEKTPVSVTNTQQWNWGGLPSTTPKEEPKNLQFSGTIQDTPAIKTEPPSDNEATTTASKISSQPLPPDSVSKTTYTPGDTSTSSVGSHKSSSTEEPPPPPDFTDVRNKAIYAARAPLDAPQENAPTTHRGSPLKEPPQSPRPIVETETSQPPLHDSDEADSDLDGSFAEVSEASGPTEGPTSPTKTDDMTGDATEELKTSPESSFEHAEDTTDTSNFTQANATEPPKLFGEIPHFKPPQMPESPRSPSPVRQVLDPGRLSRLEPARSVSAPTRPPNVIAGRRAELTKGSQPVQKPWSFDQIRQREKQAASERAQAEAEQDHGHELEDDEDELLREELERPVSPSPNLGPFLDRQASDNLHTGHGIPGQIERLYKDINSMIATLGMNARALSAFVLHQTETINPDHQRAESWNTLFRADDTDDALRDDWTLTDISYFTHGEKSLQDLLDEVQIPDPSAMLQLCHSILSKDLVHLRSRLLGIRRTLRTMTDTKCTASTPLSGEQVALQDDLRKASADVQTKLAQAERSISLLRAKLSESAPPLAQGKYGATNGGLTRSNSQKKPTVEAVTSTVAKMTSMAERKSTDIDVLEAQLRRLNMDFGGSVNGSRETSLEPVLATPHKRPGPSGLSLLSKAPFTPGSVYHTPESKLGRSTNSLRASLNGNGAPITLEDAEYWAEKARRRKEINNMLREAIMARRSKGKNLPSKSGWRSYAASAQG